MSEAGELSAEEQQLFEQMRGGEAPAEATKAEPAKAEPEKPKDEPKAEEPKPQKMVPLEAVDKARAENRELKKELAALRETLSQGDAKLQKFIDSVAKQSEAKPPKFEEDPAGNLKHENEQLRQAVAALQQKAEQQDVQGQQANRLAQHQAAVVAAERAFAKENPAYWEATKFVAEVWRDEFSEAGVDDDKIDAAVFQKALAVTSQAIQKGKNPAAVTWNLARRFGFQAKAAEPPAKAEEKADPKAAGESRLKAIEKGMEAAKTASGGAGPDDLTLASLAQMDDSQIEALAKNPDWWAKNIARSPLV